ncbi:MAG: helix-turn-helix domain-containing protein [Dysgonamonadaceae bacterium]|jgi:predicted DNA-binding transcriptional regulator AlpA|nr:helix-turn-helix domain-containing protein [Dysgonamonadaceae bacterium]
MNELNDLKRELQEIKQLTLIVAKQALTMSDASLFTGLSKSHLYKLTCYKKIPYYKSDGGKFTFFDKDELTAWQLKHKVKTADEIETEAENYMLTSAVKKKGGKHG